MLAPWKKSYDKHRQCIKKQRHHFADKGHIVKAMAFPVIVYGCESWTIKKPEHWRIDAFELWCWGKTIESPLDCKRIKPVNPKGNQPWIFTGRTLKLGKIENKRSVLQKVFTFISGWSEVKVVQLCPTLCNPMDYTIHGILQARILVWVTYPFSSRSSDPGIELRSPALQTDSLPAELPGKPLGLKIC